MTRPKIAIVANSTWNIYNFRLGLIKRLKKEGYRVTVIAPVDEYIRYLNDIYFIKHIALKKLNPQSKNPLKDGLLFKELYSIFKKQKPDLILNYTIKPNIYGNLAAKILGIPTISTLTGLGYTFLHGNSTKFFIRKLYKVALSYSHKIIFHNSDDLRLFQELKLIKREKGVVVPGSGVDTQHFCPRLKSNHEKFIFLFVGRLLYDKGIGEYVEAIRKIRKATKNTEFWVVGQINAKNPAAVSKDKLQYWLEDRTIRYFGSTKDIRPFLQEADVFVLPSYREGMPRAILEAMAMGKPIVTTNVAGCRDTVQHEKNGLLVTVRDSINLGEAMLKMYHLSKEELDKMGKRSRELVLSKFDEKIIIEQYLRLINSSFQNIKKHRTKSTNTAILR